MLTVGIACARCGRSLQKCRPRRRWRDRRGVYRCNEGMQVRCVRALRPDLPRTVIALVCNRHFSGQLPKRTRTRLSRTIICNFRGDRSARAREKGQGSFYIPSTSCVAFFLFKSRRKKNNTTPCIYRDWYIATMSNVRLPFSGQSCRCEISDG